MLNPFFLQGSKTEQGLIQDLINEQLRMYGVEIYYLPRTYATINNVIREVIQSKFENAYPLEAYVDSYDGYGGQGTLLSKFGIQEIDDLTLIISKERYESYITPLIEGIPNIQLASRPKEGDLIYFPLGDKLFEIKYVEHEQPFYQLQKNYVYTLKCELFRYEDEIIDTTVPEIDDDIKQIGYIQTLTLIGVGHTATATAHVCTDAGVNHVTITNMGNNYNTEPEIEFSSAPFIIVPPEVSFDRETTTFDSTQYTFDSQSTKLRNAATGIASITDNYINCTGITGGKVEEVYISNTGCGYTVAPWVKFNVKSRNTGSGAQATAGIGTGVIQYVSVTNAGSGYTMNPTVMFSPPVGGGITASGIGYINSAGIVTAIYLKHAGSGYTTPPTVSVASPAGIGVTVGFGDYFFNEVVVGSISGTTARVKQYDANRNTLEISVIDGEFKPGENIYGTESKAIYALKSQITDDLVTPYADNDTIEYEADNIIDFSELNPFGMP